MLLPMKLHLARLWVRSRILPLHLSLSPSSFRSDNRNYINMEIETGNQCISEKNAASAQSAVKIGTHDGTFHCDEVLACFMLKLLPEYSNAKIIRTRDNDILKGCDVVVDVGGIYDPDNLRFDHHQRSFEHSMSSIRPEKSWSTKLSSAGLVFCHFGERVLAQVLKKKAGSEEISKVFDQVYENFMEEIDAVDNGISLNDHPMRYKVTTTLSQRVGRLNPGWKDLNPDELQCFQKAIELVGTEFLNVVGNYGSDWLDSYSLVKSAIESRFEVDTSGEIIQLPNCGPWLGHLFSIEKELKLMKEIRFAILYSDENEDCRVRSIPITPDSFILRTPLLENWRGLRDQELQELSGIPGANFVHATGFIGGANDRASAIQMASKTLQNVFPDRTRGLDNANLQNL